MSLSPWTVARPAFFEVELQLDGLGASAWATSLACWYQLSPYEVCLQPSMEDIQSAINGGAVAGAPALASLSCNAQVEPPDILGTCDGVAVFTRFH